MHVGVNDLDGVQIMKRGQGFFHNAHNTCQQRAVVDAYLQPSVLKAHEEGVDDQTPASGELDIAYSSSWIRMDRRGLETVFIQELREPLASLDVSDLCHSGAIKHPGILRNSASPV